MVYNPATDFLGLWRNIAGQLSKLEMPGLDYVVAALARAGLITLSVSATAPVVNQSTTAWLRAAVPSSSGEGTLFLWDPVANTYVAATPALLFDMLQTATGQNGVSWRTSAGGPPLNTVGNNGDFSVRTDEPGGIYGPKAAGAWPVSPIPGTTDIIGSTQLDATFGTAEGQLIVRGPAVWQAFPIGAANTLMVSTGLLPQWETLSALMDAVFGNAQGSLLYRDATLWDDLAPGVVDQILATKGPGANPVWVSRTAEFPPGTVMLFQQTAAPIGWTKQVTLNDYGLRVTSGAVGTTLGTAFSTVFAQTAVGNTVLNATQIPAHDHPVGGGTLGGTAVFAAQAGGGANVPSGGPAGELIDVLPNVGGGGPHTHSVNLALSYVDVIIASKN